SHIQCASAGFGSRHAWVKPQLHLVGQTGDPAAIGNIDGVYAPLVGRRPGADSGAAALVASCVFAQDVFAQRSGSRGFGEGGYRAAAPGYVGPPRLRVVVRPELRWTGQPRLIYYPYSDLPYVPVGTPPFFLAGHAGKIDSCWGWDGYQWLNFCAGYYTGF